MIDYITKKWRDYTRSREQLIVSLLADGPLYGLELVERSGGKLARGTVYVWLSQLEAKGVIAGEPYEQGRRLYRLMIDPGYLKEQSR